MGVWANRNGVNSCLSNVLSCEFGPVEMGLIVVYLMYCHLGWARRNVVNSPLRSLLSGSTSRLPSMWLGRPSRVSRTHLASNLLSSCMRWGLLNITLFACLSFDRSNYPSLSLAPLTKLYISLAYDWAGHHVHGVRGHLEAHPGLPHLPNPSPRLRVD